MAKKINLNWTNSLNFNLTSESSNNWEKALEKWIDDTDRLIEDMREWIYDNSPKCKSCGGKSRQKIHELYGVHVQECQKCGYVWNPDISP